MAFLLYFLIFVTPFVISWLVNRRRRQRVLRQSGIPGPAPGFLFGQVLDLKFSNIPSIELWVKKYGKVVGAFEFGPIVFVADPELAHRIQVKDGKLFPMRRPFFAEGGIDADPERDVSIISNGISAQRWKEQRALITTAFTTSQIRASVPLISQATEIFLQKVQRMENEADFDIYDLFQRLTMDTIGTSAFGTNLNVQEHPENEFFEATKKILENTKLRFYLIPTYLTIVFPEFFHAMYPIRQSIRSLFKWIGWPTHFTQQVDMCAHMVQMRKQESGTVSERPNDLLQRLIDASLDNQQMQEIQKGQDSAGDSKDSGSTESAAVGKARSRGRIFRMSDNEVAANTSVLFDAGFETTATFLAFLLHVLVNRQDIQDNVRREIRELNGADGELSYNTYHSLPLLDSVMYETLRFYPPVTRFVTRQSTTDYRYKDIVIPKGAAVEIAVTCLHFDPEIWEDANTFDAMRFFGANKSRIQSPGYQVFGAGPRNCLGIRFAIMEAKLVIARLLQKFRIVPGPRTQSFDQLDIDYKFLTQNPKRGVFVKAVPLE